MDDRQISAGADARLLNYGSLNLDYVYRVERFVRPGETIHALSQSVNYGGKGLNQSIAAARAGARICHAGCIGTGGEMLLAELAANGIDTSLTRHADAPQGSAMIQVDTRGENCIIVAGGSNKCLTREQIHEDIGLFGPGDFLLLQNEVNGLQWLLAEAKARGLRVLFNPSPFDEGILDLDLSPVEWLVANRTETEAFTGESDPARAYAALHRKYPEMKLLMTLGRDGAWGFDGRKAHFQKAFDTVPVDTTAAGDTFTGFFAASLARGRSLEKAMLFGAMAAAISVTRNGAAPSIPSLAEVEERLNSAKS